MFRGMQMKASKLVADDVLKQMIDYITTSLEELEEEYPDGNIPERYLGMKTAYVECLELIQQWEKAEENGLDWDIEENFPV